MLEFQVLGPLAVHRAQAPVTVPGPMLSRLLAIFVCCAGRPVPVDTAIDELWPQGAPRAARKTLQVYVHRLRALLGEGILAHSAAGYRLDVPAAAIDSRRFETLVRQGETAFRQRDFEAADAALVPALALWRGEAFADIGGVQLLAQERQRLGEQRLDAYELHIETRLVLGRHQLLTAELQHAVQENPYRERLRAHLMLALARSGRQAEALDVYRQTYAQFSAELGVEPAPELAKLHKRLLNGEKPLLATETTTPVETGSRGPQLLPPEVANFVGRTADLERLDAMSRTAGTPAVIAGPPGAGKTALAVHWAHRVAGRYPDGRLYINLGGFGPGRPLTALEALSRLLRALGLKPEEVPHVAEEAAGAYRDLLSGKRMLILLDNAQSAEQVRPLLPGDRACFVLITSRDRLGGLVARDGAQQHILDPMTAQESHTLLEGILGPARVGAEAGAVADLARFCGHLPLALRIAAANLAAGPRQDIAGYVRRLRSDRSLASLEVSGDPQWAASAVFGWSYQQLSESQRRVFRLLGVLACDGFTVPAMAVLSGLDEAETGRILDRLAACHLIQSTEPSRFTVHDLLRLYARERAESELDAESVTAAVVRLAGHYEAQLDGAARLLYPAMLRLPSSRNPARQTVVTFGSAEAAQDWLTSEVDNVIAVMNDCADRGLHDITVRLADGLRGDFWRRRDLARWYPAARQAQASAKQLTGEPYLLVSALISLAQCLNQMARLDAAAGMYRQALASAREAGWRGAQATVAGNLGVLYSSSGDLDRGIRMLNMAASIYRTLDDPRYCLILGTLGLTLLHRGQPGPAYDRLTQAIDERDPSLGPPDVALSHRGEAARRMGRLHEAREDLERAATMARAANRVSMEAAALHYLASVHIQLGRLDDAGRAATRSLELARETNDNTTLAHALTALGAALHAEGDLDGAVGRHAEAVALARSAVLPYAEATALINLAAVHLARGEAGLARHTAAQAGSIARHKQYRLLEQEADGILGRIEARV